MPDTSDPAPGSVIPSAAIRSPLIAGARKRSFWSSVPNWATGGVAMLTWAPIPAATPPDPQRDSSSLSTASSRWSPPRPPYSRGYSSPRRPSSPIRVNTSLGNQPSRSHSPTWGRSSSATNRRISPRSSWWRSVKGGVGAAPPVSVPAARLLNEQVLVVIPAVLGIEPLDGATVGAQHPARNRAALREEVEGFAEMRVLHAWRAGPRRVQGGLSYQLPQEGRADAVGLGDDRIPVGERHVEPATEQVEQARPALRVGQREGDRLVHSPWPRRQRGLEQVGAVRGHHEDHVGVLADSVHLVQEAEEQRRCAEAHRGPLLGDEIHVLEHDHRRLEVARDGAGVGDEPER